MAIGNRDLAARGADGRTEVRTAPLRSRLRLAGLSTSDAHAIEVTFACGVTALEREVDRNMLAEAFLSNRDSVDADDVMAHFSPALRDAAGRVIETQPAEHWLSGGTSRQALLDALRAAAKPVAFNCGVELVAPFELTLASPTVEREKIESMQRKLAERRAAGQAEHVQRAAELLKQFQSLRDAAPGLSPGQVLEQIGPADRGSMLETLLLASGTSGGEAKSLWAVAGPNLVRVDPRGPTPDARLIPLPSDLGPLRSVQAAEVDGQPQLLIGAQLGVMLLDPQRPQEARKFADRDVTSPLGFNTVVAAGGMIFATHGDAGLVAWKVDDGGSPAFTIRPQGARFANAARLDDDRVIYSAGGDVFMASSAGKADRVVAGGASGNVVFIAADAAHVIVVRGDGTVELFDRQTLQRVSSAGRCGEVTSAALLPWLGTMRLLLATADGPVCCVGTDDPLVTQYASAHRGLRAVAAAPDVIAGVSGDRQRVILWKSWDGRKPATELHLASLARHRMADIAFG